MNEVVFPKDELAEFCRGNDILELSPFGSVLREDFRPDSDVDVLVVLEEAYPRLFRLARMVEELSALLVGR